MFHISYTPFIQDRIYLKMPSKVKMSKHLLLKWLRRLRLRFKGQKGYRLIANNEDDTISVDDTMLLLGDPYCEYHCADASISIHCDGLERKLFGRVPDTLSSLPEEILERIAMTQPVSTILKMSQINKHLRSISCKIMQKIDIESLWVVAHEEFGSTTFTVEVQVAGSTEILHAQGQEDMFLCARNAFTTALFILRFFDCSNAVFGVRLNNCTIPPELMHMKFPGVCKFQRVKHVHWSYAAPRQLLRLLSAGAVFF